MSVDGLAYVFGGEVPRKTICQRVAGEIPVVFVDLERAERAKLSLSPDGIDSFMFSHCSTNSGRAWVREAFGDLAAEVRERVWVARVVSGREWPVLFVCGADHTASVRVLFTRLGVKSTVVHRDFDPDEYAAMTSDQTTQDPLAWTGLTNCPRPARQG